MNQINPLISPSFQLVCSRHGQQLLVISWLEFFNLPSKSCYYMSKHIILAYGCECLGFLDPRCVTVFMSLCDIVGISDRLADHDSYLHNAIFKVNNFLESLPSFWIMRSQRSRRRDKGLWGSENGIWPVKPLAGAGSCLRAYNQAANL